MAFKWEVTPGQAFEELVDNYTNAIFVTGNRVAEQRAADMERWLKSNAPWTDRTGRARRGLHVKVRQGPAVVAEIIPSHGEDVPYGVWLEIAHGGRYAIIAPAVDYWAPIIMQDIQRMLNLGLVAR